jgi:hypothetical protein
MNARTWCSECCEDTSDLKPRYTQAWNGMYRTVWLCPSCRTPVGALATYREVIHERVAVGVNGVGAGNFRKAARL